MNSILRLQADPESVSVLRWESAHAPGTRHATLAEFVCRTYEARFGTRLPAVMPELCALLEPDGGPLAVAGFRGAAQETLFLEQYLDAPIEAAISAATGEVVRREAIWEVGNLATRCPGAARHFVNIAANELAARGAAWAAFTGTRRVLAVFRRLGIPVIRLADANPNRVADGAAAWGDYYKHSPQVVFGRIADRGLALGAGAAR